mgnify:CR=1 FL=1
MKILVIGSKGFLGRYVVDELNKEGYGMVEFKGDARKKDDIASSIDGCKAVINIIGIIRETKDKTFYDEHVVVIKNIVDAMKEKGIKKIVHVSALGTKAGAKSQYHKTKYAGELCIIDSKLDYTILRPSFLFGKEDKSINYFIKFVRKGFFIIFGDGDYKLQPVYVGDVAKAVVDSIKNKKASKNIIELGGNKQYGFNELIDLLARSRNKKIVKIHIPLWMARSLASLFGWISFFPVTREQLEMLIEGNTCNIEEFKNTFDIKLKEFEEYLQENAPYGI